MSGEIERVATDISVYGTNQTEYVVAGTSGVAYTDVVNYATLHQVSAFETQSVAYAKLAERRREKLAALGEALAVYKKNSVFKNDAGSGTKTEGDSRLRTAYETLYKGYGISAMSECCPDDANKLTRSQVTKAVQICESEIDAENAELNEISSVLQSILGKRDNAYSTASTLQRKTANTTNTLIKGFN